jgi:hypothetical protein
MNSNTPYMALWDMDTKVINTWVRAVPGFIHQNPVNGTGQGSEERVATNEPIQEASQGAFYPLSLVLSLSLSVCFLLLLVVGGGGGGGRSIFCSIETNTLRRMLCHHDGYYHVDVSARYDPHYTHDHILFL